MKIAFVSISGERWGGSEVLWVATAKEALLNGHQVLVSVFDWQPPHPAIKELKELGATLIYRRKFYPGFLKRLQKKAINKSNLTKQKATYHDYLNNYKPDRILFSLGGGDEIANDNDDLMLFIKQTSIPYSVFYHSLNTVSVYNDIVSRNFIFLLNKAKNNFFTSQMQVDLLQHQLAHIIPSVQIINHPLKAGSDNFVAYPDSTIVNFAMIGALAYAWKGQDIAIKILAGKEWEDRDWVLNIYGEGKDKMFLMQLAKHYKIDSRIIFHGYETDLGKIWKNNNILLVPSRKDSGPIVCFEAMMMARPVIGSYMGAMPEYIVTNETGILANGIAERDFSEALETAWQKKTEWEQWGIHARNRLKKMYDFHPQITLLDLILN